MLAVPSHTHTHTHTHTHALRERDTLLRLDAEAQAAGVGMHAPAANAAAHVRSVSWSTDARTLFDQYKGQVVPSIVDQVRDGSTFRVELIDPRTPLQHHSIVLHLAGVACPRTPLPLSVLQAQQPAGAPPVKEEKPGPFAVEAKQFVEDRLLHRDVGVRLEGIDKSGNFFGSLEFPQGNISHALLKNGLGKTVQWSAALTAAPKVSIYLISFTACGCACSCNHPHRLMMSRVMRWKLRMVLSSLCTDLV
jgi:staphylococcal nuclease domain-containing protein 1